MSGKQFKSSGVRRLGQQPLHAEQNPHNSHQQQQHQQPHQQQQQPVQAQQTKPAVPPARSSKAQALSAFRSAVHGSSRARLSTVLKQQDHAPTHPAPLAPTAANPPAGASIPAATTTPAPAPPAPAPGAPAAALKHTHTPEPGTTAAQPASAPAPIPAQLPNPQLIPKASKALDKLQQQLSSRTLTYLYQFDSLLSTASSTLRALVSSLSAQHGSCGPVSAHQSVLQQLARGQQGAGQDTGTKAAEVLELLLQLCMQTWVRT